MKKVIGALLLLVAVSAAAPAIASADYPNDPPVVQFGGGSVSPGGSLTLTTQNFCPGAVVTFSIGGTNVGTATASATGVASVQTTAPATAGSFTVQAISSTPCALSTQSTLTVTAPPISTNPGTLPDTGSEPMNWVRTGGITVLVGLGLIGAARLRRRPVVG